MPFLGPVRGLPKTGWPEAWAAILITSTIRLFRRRKKGVRVFLQNQPTVIHHAVNTRGRDFIVGDLHGCRSMLDALLRHVGFDTATDRLFSVGDLVDRGPDSEGCLELLEHSWFHAVLGNHDAMLLAWILGKTRDPRQQMYEYAFTHNKGWKWTKTFVRGTKFLPLLESLPLVRVIGKDAGPMRFHVAHAELRTSNLWRGFNDLELDLTDTDGNGTWDEEHFIPGFDGDGTWRDHVLWGRSLISEIQRCTRENVPLPREQHPNLSTTYVGHTIMPPVFGQNQNMPLRIQSHVFLDRGAFKAASVGKDGDPRFGLTLWSNSENRGWMLGGNGAVRDLQEDY